MKNQPLFKLIFKHTLLWIAIFAMGICLMQASALIYRAYMPMLKWEKLLDLIAILSFIFSVSWAILSQKAQAEQSKRDAEIREHQILLMKIDNLENVATKYELFTEKVSKLESRVEAVYQEVNLVKVQLQILYNKTF